ncbi:hypothetical protein GCM10010342_76120 [Streptomyces anulatus]|nr:hypothetical protein GCM10010342_76120 [Streptomyces anulatus]
MHSMTRTTPALTGGVCPTCQLIMEACTCTGVSQLLTALAPRAGVADEIGDLDDRSGDDGRGYERDETERFHQLVRQLTAEGDDLAAAVGRQARRTFAEMAPGQSRQPVLHLTRPLTFTPTLPAGPTAGGQCDNWQGTGGRTVDTSADGVTRQHWQSCGPCGGTGVAR